MARTARTHEVMPACQFSIDRWIICISGFTQTVDSPSGVHDLWLRLGSFYRAPKTSVELFAWKADFAQVAEGIKIARNAVDPLVMIVGYSWGAGRGFVELANELRHRDIRVAAAVLCDPVYYSRWNPAGAVVGERTIDVPDNVDEVRWLFQRTDRFPMPHGHRPVAVDDRLTTIYPGIELRGVNHNSMDDTDGFRKLAEDTAYDLFARRNAIPIGEAAGRVV